MSLYVTTIKADMKDTKIHVMNKIVDLIWGKIQERVFFFYQCSNKM